MDTHKRTCPPAGMQPHTLLTAKAYPAHLQGAKLAESSPESSGPEQPRATQGPKTGLGAKGGGGPSTAPPLHTHERACTRACAPVCMRVCTQCVHGCVHGCVRMGMWLCVYVAVCVHRCVYSECVHRCVCVCICTYTYTHIYISSVQFLSRVRLFATPRTAARQASPSITNSQSLLKLMSIESVMPSNHLILCCPLLLRPSIFPSIRVFSNESALRIRGQNIGVSASTSVLPMNIQD